MVGNENPKVRKIVLEVLIEEHVPYMLSNVLLKVKIVFVYLPM